MKLKIILSAIFIGILFSNSLKGQMIDLTLEELVKNSNHIVHCKLKKMDSYINKDAKGIYTDIYFENINSVKGDIKKSENIRITIYGGTYNGITTYSPHYPSFNINEESILFLNKIESKIPEITKYAIYGSYFGKFDILNDKSINEFIVLRNKGYSELVIGNFKEKIVIDNITKVTLNNFKEMIKSCL